MPWSNRRALAILGLLTGLLCCETNQQAPPPTPAPPSRDAGRPEDSRAQKEAAVEASPDLPSPPPQGQWRLLHQEDFEDLQLPQPSWQADTYPDDGPFADRGIYFRQQQITPPAGYRIAARVGLQQWLTIESYSRSKNTAFSSLVAVTDDPNGTTNRVLRLASPAHTDGTVIRSTHPLPDRYRISVRVGYAHFGDGKAGGTNGYDGGERAEPWIQAPATEENGFYWLAIVDAAPRPHNNIWLHHHRKLVVDSDNHYPPWMEIYNGQGYVESGENPVMIFALDGRGPGDEKTGKPFISWAAGQWHPSGKICAADAYRPQRWYRVTIERSGDQFTLQLTGDFKFGGQRTYRAAIDASARCVWHYNRAPLGPDAPCVDNRHYPSLDPSFPHWPADRGYDDYFLIGDPHTNYYEGHVYYDDLRLEVWEEP